MSKKLQTFIQLGLFVGILLLLNVMGNFFYTYFDMTEEKRYTLTQASSNLLETVDDPVYVQILLAGDFPAGFKRLQTAVTDLLEDFRSESGYIEYTFDDPNAGSVDDVNARREQLAKDGIVPVNLRLKDTEGTAEKIIYPYAIVNYKGRLKSINLLENEQIGVSPELVLNNSVSLLEYKFANAIQKLHSSRKPNIAFIKGHGELAPIQVRDLEKTLRLYYDTGHLSLDSMVHIPANRVDLLIIAKPQTEFSDRDKFKIDQYVMNGGKILWLIDRMDVNIAKIDQFEKYIPRDYPLNLEDLWFKYGIRIQPNLVLDLECSRIPLAVGKLGSQAQFELFPFYYHPVVAPKNNHPIVKSLDRVNLFFPSSIDTTVRTKTAIEKTVLLTSSQYTRMQYSPVTLEFEPLRYPAQPERFNKPFQPVAVLYEGVFSSLFENRVTENMLQGLQALDLEFKKESTPTRMIVVSDGDAAKNLFTRNGEEQEDDIRPLGFNRYEKYVFSNKDFILNSIEYLIDDNGIIEARGKDVKLRLLDTVRAKAEQTQWQIINIVLPLIFLALFGFGYNLVRRRRFAR